MEIDLVLRQIPNLARGCRLREVSGEAATLQIPEGQIKMSGAGLEIVKLCDGVRTVQEILSVLKNKYPEPAHVQIETETISFIKRLVQRAALSLT